MNLAPIAAQKLERAIETAAIGSYFNGASTFDLSPLQGASSGGGVACVKFSKKKSEKMCRIRFGFFEKRTIAFRLALPLPQTGWVGGGQKFASAPGADNVLHAPTEWPPS